MKMKISCSLVVYWTYTHIAIHRVPVHPGKCRKLGWRSSSLIICEAYLPLADIVYSKYSFTYLRKAVGYFKHKVLLSNVLTSL